MDNTKILSKGLLSRPKLVEVSYKNCNLKFYLSSADTKFRVKTLFSKEPSTIAWLKGLRSDDTLLDIGANIGIYTILAAAVTGCRVISVEPESQNFSILCKNIFLNEIENRVTPFCCAISNENKIGLLYLKNFGFDNAGSGHMFNEELGQDLLYRKSAFKQGCIGIKLDDAIACKSISVPNFIKIDVDGLEHKVIEGSINTLKNPKVRSVLIEIDTKLDEHVHIINTLESIGFKYNKEQAYLARRKSGVNKGLGNVIFDKDLMNS